MPNVERVTETVEDLIVHYMLSFKRLCLVTVSCPLLSLIICLITAFIFQPDDIHETHCKVYNIVPSISAITGISPQRYLWRISVAFHIGPRCIIAAVHRAYHFNLINKSASVEAKRLACWWLNFSFWCNVTEIGALCGVTYISNRENYPLHEKLFIAFMASSLLHMFACIKGLTKVAETRGDFSSVETCLKIKKGLLAISLISTAGLVTFFLEHRLLCHRMAFSAFAFCEYIIAIANMAFHITVILDFPTEHLVIARGMEKLRRSEFQENSKFE